MMTQLMLEIKEMRQENHNFQEVIEKTVNENNEIKQENREMK